ncbi:MAG: hypothetical protein HW395_1569 [candidate division NC10 bacterium]|nr:hypothetical protein [candidate division NC10 bacterium]
MVPGGHRTTTTRCNLDGALPSNALAGATQPERAFVFLGRGVKVPPPTLEKAIYSDSEGKEEIQCEGPEGCAARRCLSH